ncbi:MAG: N-acetylmuramoyl-L-alanine amidase [Prevotella sp.]|nr:N-acetylmuramoyl-L-alanine amidase [Prevotella sp.]
MKRITTLALSAALLLSANAQKDLNNKLDEYFKNYRPIGQRIRSSAHLKSLEINDSLQHIEVTADTHLGEQTFTPQVVENIYHDIQAMMPDSCQNYQLSIKTGGWDLRQLIPNRFMSQDDPNRVWGDINYQGKPWVSNASQPYQITQGLQNRHVSLWASHGRYYNIKGDKWEWQRPPLFGTREDLFTQTIVVPYLIPMLEKAGAVVFTPRERDWQRHEVIVDNDNPRKGGLYVETQGSHDWQRTDSLGFAFHDGVYVDQENPFRAGTARQVETVEHSRSTSEISYLPTIPEAGRYAVYVSYQTVPGSIDDAHYTVWHQGIPTEFRVNQQMGGSTWVYLGTFDFDKGSSADNRVVLTNQSRQKGIVTADAVRFGGGMGNIRRGYTTSGLPRCLEGARYYAQWAGMPYSVYSSKNGEDDYGDDINVRSLMANLLAGGSCYMPDTTGRNVPIELSLAIHSDAGYTSDGKSHTGTLAVCTTYLNDSVLSTGRSRLASRDLADELLSTVPKEMQRKYGSWQTRELWDRNYSESRVPEVPSAILETMSHQNFADMRYGQDPNFRFDLARSIYKTLLRYISRMHHTSYIVSPLTPNHLRVELLGGGEARLSWNSVEDPDEPSAKPMGYIVYTAKDKGGFDNGLYVKDGETSLTLDVEPGLLYSFRVAAVNNGGESFPSEVVSTLYVPEAQKTVLIVNGFHRLASPAVRDNAAEQGFDIKYDPGVTYGRTAGWTGYQTCFNKATMGKTTSDGLGFTNDSLAGQFIAGNDFNYVRTHAEAIAAAKRYNIVSCSSEALENNEIRPTQYNMVDLILGLEKNDGWSLRRYQAFPPMLRQHLQLFTSRGGALLVSGSYVGADMTMPSERKYLEQVLKCTYEGTNKDSLDRDTIIGLGTTFEFHRHLNETHYAAPHPDILQPVAPAFSAMKYADEYSACVAYDGKDYKAMTLGFPFECIKSEQKRHTLMKGILRFLLQSL